MKPPRVRSKSAVCAFAAAALALVAATQGAAADNRDAHRIVSLLDYVAGDYPLAVKDGKVTSQAEYDEQKNFVSNARALLSTLRDPRAAAVRGRLESGLAALLQLVERVAPPAEVATKCRALKDELVGALGLVMAPSRSPNLARAKDHFANVCASCHGATGKGDGPAAAALDPKPASFHDEARMGSITPSRVFNALKFGVEKTAMVSFEKTLSEEDRWSLAFYVLSLRHEAVPEPSGATPRLPLGVLALSSDTELTTRLAALDVPERQRACAVAMLRKKLTFEPAAHEASFAHARRLVEEAAAASARGDHAAAARAAIDAYLEGFEPVEMSLRMRDSLLLAVAERAFTGLRVAIADQDAARVTAQLAAVREAINKSEALLASKAGNATVAFVGSFLILFREGLEASLLIAALLALLSRLGHARAQRYVHYGWLGALALGAATYFIAHGLLQMGAGQREIMEGVLSLLAALILFYVSYWLLSKSDVARWMAYLKGKLAESAGKPGGLWAIAGISFLAVYREALETVLFYQALLIDVRGQELAVLGGAGAGALALVVAVLLIFKLGKRLPLTAFFLGSGALLCALAAVLAGKGVHALQEAGVIPIAPIGVPRVDWLGLYGDAISVAVQGVVLALLISAAVYALAKRRSAAAS